MELECAPTIGSCPGQFDRQYHSDVVETLGLVVPGSAMLPAGVLPAPRPRAPGRRDRAPHPRRRRPPPRDLVTRKSLENACAAVAATGGSTNAGLHLPAIAHEAGHPLCPRRRRRGLPAGPRSSPTCSPAANTSRATCTTRAAWPPSSKALLDGGYLHGEALALSGRTLAAELAAAPGPDGSVVRPASSPIHPTGGVVVLKGNLCPGAPSSRSPGSSPSPSPAPPASSSPRRPAQSRCGTAPTARARCS